MLLFVGIACECCGAPQGMKRSPSVDLQCEDTYLGYDEEDDDLTASVSPTDPSGVY